MIINKSDYDLKAIVRASKLLKKYASLPNKKIEFFFVQHYRVNDSGREWEAQYRLTIKHANGIAQESFGGGMGLRSYYHIDKDGREFGGYDDIHDKSQENKELEKCEKKVNELTSNLNELQDKMLKLSNKTKDFEKKKGVLLPDSKTRIMKEIFKGIDQIAEEYKLIQAKSIVPFAKHLINLKNKRDSIITNFIENNTNHIKTLTSFEKSYESQSKANTK